MEEKKEMQTTEIAKNISSGAEKVESIEKKVAKKKTTKEKAKAEQRRADKRVKTALKKKEAKTKKKQEKEKLRKAKAEERKRLLAMNKAERKAELQKRKAERKARKEKLYAEKKARLEKRRAEVRAQMEKREAERKVRAEKRKAMREERIRERAHKKANRRQEKNKQRNKKRERKEERTPGFGGWLAAVIALGAVTLALGSVVTVGAIEMSSINNGMNVHYQSATYALAEAMENVDNDLDRVRLSTDTSQQSRILTDVMVQSRLAEVDLEKLPVPQEKDAHLTAFINKLAMESGRMLNKLQNGQPLNEKDYQILQALYEKSSTLRAQLDEYTANMQCKDFSCYMKKGKGALADTLDRLEKTTLEENQVDVNKENGGLDGAGKEQNARQTDKKLDCATAEQLCNKYFAEYNVQQFQCVGETNLRGGVVYNVQGYDEKGTQLFAQIHCSTGKLVGFEYHEDCNGEALDAENCTLVAEKFLTSLGYENMVLVRARKNGNSLDFQYATELDGVVVYPQSVRVKVCQERGVVSAFDASAYLRNEKAREIPSTTLTEEQAQARLRSGITVENGRLAIVKTMRGERLAYEFVCSYMDGRYVMYLDAQNGNEIAILNLNRIGA